MILVFAAVLATLISSQFSKDRRSILVTRSIEIVNERQVLGRVLSERVDCKATLNPASVPGGPPPPGCVSNTMNLGSGDTGIRLKTQGGGDLLDAKGRLGSWEVKATCDATGLLISAALTGSGAGGFQSEPLSGQALDHRHPRSRLSFRDLPVLLCDAMFGAAAGPKLNLQVGPAMVADSCPGSYDAANKLCSAPFEKTILFTTAYSAPPKVTVVPAEMPTSDSACKAFGRYYASAKNVTTTGFQMICAASPSPTDNGLGVPAVCAASSTRFSKGACTWFAQHS